MTHRFYGSKLTPADIPLLKKRQSLMDEQESLRATWELLNPSSVIGMFGGTVESVSLHDTVRSEKIQQRYKEIEKELAGLKATLGSKPQRLDSIQCNFPHKSMMGFAGSIPMVLIGVSGLIWSLQQAFEYSYFPLGGLLLIPSLVVLALVAIGGFCTVAGFNNAFRPEKLDIEVISDVELDAIRDFDSKLALRIENWQAAVERRMRTVSA